MTDFGSVMRLWEESNELKKRGSITEDRAKQIFQRIKAEAEMKQKVLRKLCELPTDKFVENSYIGENVLIGVSKDNKLDISSQEINDTQQLALFMKGLTHTAAAADPNEVELVNVGGQSYKVGKHADSDLIVDSYVDGPVTFGPNVVVIGTKIQAKSEIYLENTAIINGEISTELPSDPPPQPNTEQIMEVLKNMKEGETYVAVIGNDRLRFKALGSEFAGKNIELLSDAFGDVVGELENDIEGTSENISGLMETLPRILTENGKPAILTFDFNPVSTVTYTPVKDDRTGKITKKDVRISELKDSKLIEKIPCVCRSRPGFIASCVSRDV